MLIGTMLIGRMGVRCCAVLCDRANFRGSAAPRVARYFSAAASAAAAASAEDKRPGAK
jgi:hypothetical protein